MEEIEKTGEFTKLTSGKMRIVLFGQVHGSGGIHSFALL